MVHPELVAWEPLFLICVHFVFHSGLMGFLRQCRSETWSVIDRIMHAPHIPPSTYTTVNVFCSVQKDFAGVIKDLKIGRIAWIIQVGPV